MSTLADSIPSDECYTIEELAQEFGVSILRTRQILKKVFDKRLVQKLVKTEGARVLYAPQMVKQLLELRDSGKLGKTRSKLSKSALNQAQLVITVPIFDKDLANFLRSKFKNEEGMSKFLKARIEDEVRPFLEKKRQLEDRYEKELARLFNSDIAE